MEFKGDGVVGIDLAGQEFHPGIDPDECEHRKVFAVCFLFSKFKLGLNKVLLNKCV